MVTIAMICFPLHIRFLSSGLGGLLPLLQREAMLKSLSLTSHAKARERNAGFREETADICSERGGAILPPLCNQKHFFPNFSGILPPPPPHARTHTLLDLLVDSTVSISFFALCFQIGDLGKRSFLIEDLHRYVPKCIPLRI
jgi:hypothetical protein